MSFNLNLPHACQSINTYVKVLKNVSLERINTSEINKIVNSSSTTFRKHNIKNYEQNLPLRTLHYCLYVHPLDYSNYGRYPSWYRTDLAVDSFFKGINFYENNDLEKLKKFVTNQKSFIAKIQNSNIDFNTNFPEESLIRYEKFMTLAKKFDHLTPPLDVDFVWHAHMLDHGAYTKATKKYFNKILDHRDEPLTLSEMQDRYEKTKLLWEKHLNSSFSSNGDREKDKYCDDSHFWSWFYGKNSKEEIPCNNTSTSSDEPQYATHGCTSSYFSSNQSSYLYHYMLGSNNQDKVDAVQTSKQESHTNHTQITSCNDSTEPSSCSSACGGGCGDD